MKNALKLVVFVLILTACGRTSQENADVLDSLKLESKALYNEAIDIHDEVMPKMDQLVMLKKSLKDTLENTTALPETLKKEIEAKIQLLDSADKAMMDWMHDSRLRPISDTTNHAAYQQYMQSKIESAKRMKALTLEAIEKGKL